ncbi:MAG TPA: TonB-dependent receptor plug domain-containing protein [Candidatus Dormibacteraeota bacterium]|nr:TonB-dependent receptor plug domain-containing protein [Candidatus Dormibacteraeota bacterium]
MVAAAAVGAMADAQAQQTQGAAPGGNAASPQLAEIVITGSSIPTTPDTVAVPVDTLSAAQLEASGVDSNALEILRKEIPAFQGRSNAGTSNANNNNQNTAGGSQVQLRNLPTLVLVDGRRVATSGIGGINGKNFVDVNQIPPQAIDHVDVLTDGASSIYGSDPVGGVVNFVLKSDYKGLTAGARAADGADYGEWSAFAVGGLPIGQGNITTIVNFTHTDPLFQSDRPFSSPLYGKTSALPGTVNGANDILSPGIDSPSARNPTGVNATAGSLGALVANGTYLPGSPSAVANAFDISPYQTLLLKQDLASLVSTFNFPIADRDKLALFGDLMVSQDRAWTQWAPVFATGLTVPAGAPFNPLTTGFPGVTFSYLPDGHDFYDTTTAARFTAGLRGEFTPAWTWETALVYSESDLEQNQTNVIFKPNLAPAIAGGYNAAGQPLAGGPYSLLYSGYSLGGAQVLQPALDPFATAAGVNPGSLANLYGTEVIRAISQLESWDGQIVGRMPGLPAGDVGLAVGATVRREALSGHADPNGRVTDPVTGAYGVNSQLWIGGTFADPFSAARTITGAFTEVRVPLTSEQWSVPALRAFDLTGAVRSEHYSDAGNSTVPKFGFRWEPFDRQLVFRGDYSKSFLAPNLYSEVGPTDTRLVAGTVIAGVFGPNYNALPFNGEDGNNPDLKPATSSSKTVGFVFKPNIVKGLSVTADYSYIVLKGFQAGIGFNNMLSSVNTLGSASPYFANLAIGNFAGLAGSSNPFTAPGALLAYLTNPATGMGDPTKAANLYLIDRFENNAELLEESWNLGATYTIPTDRLGIFTVVTTGSIFDSFAFQGLPGQAYIQYAGHATNAGVFGGTLPKYHFYTTLDWAYRDFDFGVANTYLSALTDTGVNGNLAPLPVSRYSAWDLRAAYTWQKVKAAVGVNNVTNRMPPLAPRTFTDNNADVATYSPIGRLVYATVTVTL